MKIRKQRVDGVIQNYHVLGRGHSADVYDIGKGRALKHFPGRVQAVPGLDRDNEFSKYIKLQLYKHPIIIPMKWTPKGIIMPKLRVITRSSIKDEWKKQGFTFLENKNITTKQLQTLWIGLRKLSKASIESQDVLHVGIASNNKPYIFDIGGFGKTNVTDAELANEQYWETFTKKIGREDMKILFPEKPSTEDIIKEFKNLK